MDQLAAAWPRLPLLLPAYPQEFVNKYINYIYHKYLLGIVNELTTYNKEILLLIIS